MEEAAMSGFSIRGGTGFRGCGNHNNNIINHTNTPASASASSSPSPSSSTGTKCGRWNPTAEQVKLLTELFTSGLRTPTTDQIQKISSHLSFYGHIESKNVFYWFQNHKARERQKRRKLSSHDHTNNNHHDLPPHNSKSAEKNKVMNQHQVCSEPARVIETLELFPLNSFGESETEKMSSRVHVNCRDDTMFSYTHHQGEQTDHPPLDLRLSFL